MSGILGVFTVFMELNMQASLKDERTWSKRPTGNLNVIIIQCELLTHQ